MHPFEQPTQRRTRPCLNWPGHRKLNASRLIATLLALGAFALLKPNEVQAQTYYASCLPYAPSWDSSTGGRIPVSFSELTNSSDSSSARSGYISFHVARGMSTGWVYVYDNNQKYIGAFPLEDYRSSCATYTAGASAWAEFYVRGQGRLLFADEIHIAFWQDVNLPSINSTWQSASWRTETRFRRTGNVAWSPTEGRTVRSGYCGGGDCRLTSNIFLGL